MRALRTYNCADCGVEVRRRRSPSQPLVCVNCGAERSRLQQIGMANHDPYYWEQWANAVMRSGMAAWAESQGRAALETSVEPVHANMTPGMRRHSRRTAQRIREYGS